MPYLLELANKGVARACTENRALGEGVNVHAGEVVYAAVAESQGRSWRPLSAVM